MERRLLLDVVVAQGAALLELLAGENEALLVGGDALLVLDLGLDVLNGVARLYLQGDGLACRWRGSGRQVRWAGPALSLLQLPTAAHLAGQASNKHHARSAAAHNQCCC